MTNSFPSKNKFKYMRKFKSFCDGYGQTFRWNGNNMSFRIGEAVKVGHTHADHAGKEGKIGAGVKKDEPNMLKVVFEDGKSDYISKHDLVRHTTKDHHTFESFINSLDKDDK